MLGIRLNFVAALKILRIFSFLKTRLYASFVFFLRLLASNWALLIYKTLEGEQTTH
jgi:hypothetical protein